MTQSDDDLKAMILARRARFVALALSASGLSVTSLAACGGKTTDDSGENQPVQSADPTNTGTPPTPTPCLTIATQTTPTASPTPCLQPLPPDLPTASPTPCLSMVPTTPMVCLGATPEPTPCLEPVLPPVAVDAGPVPIPEPTACLSPIYVPVPLDAGVADAGIDAGSAFDAAPTPCLSVDASPPPDLTLDETAGDDTPGAGGASSDTAGSGGTN